MLIAIYKGWAVYETQTNFIAIRHGVSMNTNTRDGICRMIDNKQPLFPLFGK